VRARCRLLALRNSLPFDRPTVVQPRPLTTRATSEQNIRDINAYFSAWRLRVEAGVEMSRRKDAYKLHLATLQQASARFHSYSAHRSLLQSRFLASRSLSLSLSSFSLTLSLSLSLSVSRVQNTPPSRALVLSPVRVLLRNACSSVCNFSCN
jgi:hypothetical protein